MHGEIHGDLERGQQTVHRTDTEAVTGGWVSRGPRGSGFVSRRGGQVYYRACGIHLWHVYDK